MRKRLLRRPVRLPSPAMVVALLALFVALGGSATSAVLITSADIRNGTIRGIDVRNGALGGLDVRNNSIRGADVREGTLAKVPNANRLDGLDSTRFFPGPNLPRGKTIRGVYRLQGNDQGTGADVDSVSDPIRSHARFATNGALHRSGRKPSGAVSGHRGPPRAAPGHLCIYEGFRQGAPVPIIPDVTRYGVAAFSASTTGLWEIWGTWAVGAP
jgi:hypothetical protein